MAASHACMECARSCDLAAWYPAFKHVTFETELIDLDNDAPGLLGYLQEGDLGGIRLPEPVCSTALLPIDPRAALLPKRGGASTSAQDSHENPDSSDRDHAEDGASVCPSDDELHSSDSSQQPFSSALPQAEERIAQALHRLGGSAFVKLSWSAPRDATWVMQLGTLQAQSPGDVFLLLKASDLISYDLQLADRIAQQSRNPAPRSAVVSLALRRWYNLHGSGEFRVFVLRGEIVGICQRHTSERYSHLAHETAAVDNIRSLICDFHNKRVRGRFPLPSYVMDVYVDRRDRVWLIDFGAFGGDTEALLFDWEELVQLAECSSTGTHSALLQSCIVHGIASSSSSAAAAAAMSTTSGDAGSGGGRHPVPFRVVTEERMQFAPLSMHKYPDELLELAAEQQIHTGGRDELERAHGGGVEAMIDALRERGVF